MTSRPAAPESETPLGECSGPFSDAKDCPVHKGDLLAPASCGHNDRFKCVFGLPREDNGCLACALERTERQHSLAQTEIKGHMRVEEELKAELAAHKTVIGLLFESLPDCPFMGDLPGYVDEMKARIAELEKAIQRVVETDDFDDLELDDGLWTNSARRFLQAALKDRA